MEERGQTRAPHAGPKARKETEQSGLGEGTLAGGGRTLRLGKASVPSVPGAPHSSRQIGQEAMHGRCRAQSPASAGPVRPPTRLPLDSALAPRSRQDCRLAPVPLTSHVLSVADDQRIRRYAATAVRRLPAMPTSHPLTHSVARAAGRTRRGLAPAARAGWWTPFTEGIYST